MAENSKPSPVEDAEIVPKDQPSGSETPATDAENKQIVLARELLPERLPIFPATQRPLFPKMTVPVVAEDDALKRMLMETAKSPSRFVGVVLAQWKDKQPHTGPVTAADLHGVGVVAEILQVAQAGSDGPVQALISATERFRVTDIAANAPHIVARVEYVFETEMAANDELRAYSLAVIKSIKDLIQLEPLHKEELKIFMSHSSLNEPGRLADFAAALTTSTGPELQEVLETFAIPARLRKVLALLKKEIDISKLQVDINRQIEEKVSKQQREYFLREQLKAIKKELGLAKEGKEAEAEKFEERLKALKLPEEAATRVAEEMEKLRLLEPASPEFNVTRNYLDWLTALPWGVFTTDAFDLPHAAAVLNRDHYGLEDVKDRILEFLSVGILKGNISGSIVCFVGPPGVGKTSLGRSIAASIGRNFYRFSVGGMKDEAEIKGHRRTYIGALPGKFVQAMKQCKSANPVIMIDEVDKIGASYQGDPASALLEVLDPEQNRDFQDHYLDVRFDLSHVLFICTANQLDTIPRPLLDRMEVIKLAGYVMKEKMEIARRFLLPKQLEAHGVKDRQVRMTTAAIREIVDGYAREPGVRGLENAIKKCLRKTVKRIVEKGEKGVIRLDRKDVPDLLGQRVFRDDDYHKKPKPGVVMGLAWTSLGGDTLYVEAAKVATGRGGFKQTGQLGDVMVESSEIAYTHVRSMLGEGDEGRRFFARHFVHLHVPAGATPKDGPSAGITMATALYSLAIGKPVKRGLAMTGELTLTGEVIPIGGVKEKTIAAKRAGVKTLIFPEGNRKDFEELPAYIRKGLKVHFVSTFTQVVDLCF